MSEFTKAIPGAPLVIPAAAYNAMLDAANARAFSQRIRGSRSKDSWQPPHIINIQNNTGANVARFNILGLDTPTIVYPASPSEEQKFFENCTAFSGIVPDFATHEKRWCLTLESIPAPIGSGEDGRFGKAAVLGVSPCQISVVSETDTEAKIIDADTLKLESCASGGTADILWKQSGTGTKWAIIFVRPFGATGGGGSASLEVVQAVADGSAGVLSTKVMTLKADLAASPNFTLAATAANAAYYHL